jgi:hypothetical protein
MKQFLAVILLSLSAFSFGEGSSVVDLTLLGGVIRGKAEPEMAVLANGQWTWKSQGVENAKTEIVLDITAADTVLFNIAKAQIRLFFGDLEVSVGKTRSNWGAGNFFNAGDLIFEEVPSDLTVDELRSTNRWMLIPRYYLGDFTYIDLIALAPPYNLGEQLAAQLATPPQPIPPGPGFDQASGGGRIFHDFGPLQGQLGYLYSGERDKQTAYLSLGWAWEWDFYFASSYAWGLDNFVLEEQKENLLFTAGTYSQGEIGGVGTFTWRFEGEFRPYGSREPFRERTMGELPQWQAASELTFSPSTLFNLFIRAIVDPWDLSATSTLGLSWNYDKGITLLGYASNNLGGAEQRYSWVSQTGWNYTLGVRSRF